MCIRDRSNIQALSELHEQTGVISLFPFDLVVDKVSNRVIGRFTLQQGLSLMLENTGLTGGLSNEQVISISVAANVPSKNKQKK